LFVLGLFLLSPRARPLLWQVSAYTVAHSVTLGLAMAGIWQLPGDIVEPVIAASIVYVAIENLYTSELNPWRPVLVLLFGLLHGLGFAGVLGEIGMPTDGFFTALLSFNVGVELGQLAVIAIAFALVFQIRERPTYRRWVVIPTSAVIALIGFYWTIERVYF
ncbi:MAG: HupE/UreJ family protein, partial [Myxococcota bacterium]